MKIAAKKSKRPSTISQVSSGTVFEYASDYYIATRNGSWDPELKESIVAVNLKTGALESFSANLQVNVPAEAVLEITD